MKVGDIIKSYDFHFNTKSYVVGVVTSLDSYFVQFDCIKQVWENEMVEINEVKMQTALPGMMMLDEKFERVVVLG